MDFKYNDGGREIAGYKGSTGDCGVRSICIATEKDYQEIYDAINNLGEKERRSKRRRRKSNSRLGVYRKTAQKYLESIGWIWIPTMAIGSGCKVHMVASELPMGRLICRVSRHFVAVIDHVINDTFDCSRDENRCVYGFFVKADRLEECKKYIPEKKQYPKMSSMKNLFRI